MAETSRIPQESEIPGCVVKEIEKKLYKTLKDIFGYDSYKSLVQKRAVEAVAKSAQDVFVSMPTGAGKSLCYQLPALISEKNGITVVVSPLLALMSNQINQMKSIGICTETINSKMSAAERERVKTDLTSSSPKTKLLYITPELASTTGFRTLIQHLFNNNNVARFVVDEAHCVSQWGHSFRPDYLCLGELREKYMSVPWVALTATASVKVMDDIFLQLKLCQPVAIFKTSCFRPNLFYDVVFKETLDDPYEDLKDFANSALGDHWEMTPPSERGCGIIYCRTRDGCEELSWKLTKLGLLTQPYHAGIKPAVRNETQCKWMQGKVPVIAATVSFGMGIDKPTVRFVAHWCVSQSVAGYYQESGRAGRDGQPAKCRIYYSRKDRDTILFLLKKDENTAKSKLSKMKIATSIKSFNVMIRYCEEIICRHYLLSREFGDDIPDCKKYCDVCCSRKAVEKKVAQFQSSMLGSKICAQRGRKSPGDYNSLYGGGRKGQAEETDAYYHDNAKADHDEKNAGRALSALISKEFEKRRGFKEESEKCYLGSSKVLEPNLKKISGLSISTREKYVEKLTDELKLHLSSCAVNSCCPVLSEKDVRSCAAEYELNCYRMKGNIHMYRKDFVHIFKSLREASRQVEVHPLVSNYLPSSKLKEKPKTVPKGQLYSVSDFVSKQNFSDCLSDFKYSNHSSSHSYLNSHKACESLSKKTKCFTGEELEGKVVSDRVNFSDGKRSVITKACESSDSEKSSLTLVQNTCLTDTSKSAIETKPMIKYFFESVACHDESNSHKSSPEISVKSFDKVQNLRSSRSCSMESSKRLSQSSDDCTSEVASPKKRKKHELKCQLSAEKQKKVQLKTPTQVQNNNLKKAADLVRKHLNPQYKANKISKDLFKIVCRSISHRLVEANLVNDTAAKSEVEKLFQQYSLVSTS